MVTTKLENVLGTCSAARSTKVADVKSCPNNTADEEPLPLSHFAFSIAHFRGLKAGSNVQLRVRTVGRQQQVLTERRTCFTKNSSTLSMLESSMTPTCFHHDLLFADPASPSDDEAALELALVKKGRRLRQTKVVAMARVPLASLPRGYQQQHSVRMLKMWTQRTKRRAAVTDVVLKYDLLLIGADTSVHGPAKSRQDTVDDCSSAAAQEQRVHAVPAWLPKVPKGPAPLQKRKKRLGALARHWNTSEILARSIQQWKLLVLFAPAQITSSYSTIADRSLVAQTVSIRAQ